MQEFLDAISRALGALAKSAFYALVIVILGALLWGLLFH
jgi:hypothetical protein